MPLDLVSPFVYSLSWGLLWSSQSHTTSSFVQYVRAIPFCSLQTTFSQLLTRLLPVLQVVAGSPIRISWYALRLWCSVPPILMKSDSSS